MTSVRPARRWNVVSLVYPLAVFGVLLALLATWAVATPLFASPDEPAHLFKAYGTAHGEAIGVRAEGFGPTIRQFDVPPEMGTPVLPPLQGLRCYFGLPEVPAACATGAGGTGISTAAVLPPFWYGLVGGGARLLGADASQRAYRLVNAALCAALFAAAFASTRRSSLRRFSPMLFVALTPMTLFLAGTVHPNGFEIAAFAALWSLALHLDHPRAATATGGVLVGTLFAAVLLSRFGAALSVATASVVVMIVLGRKGLKRFANRRFLTGLIAPTLLAVVALVAWSRYAGVSVNDSRSASSWTRWHIITYTVGALPEIARQIVGVLGWLDTGIPRVAYGLYAVFTLALLAGVVLSRNRRLIVAAAALVAALAVVPVAVNLISARTAGLIWQGRYSIPLFIGLGPLGMIGWREYLQYRSDRSAGRLALAMCAAFATAEILAFWQSLRRFSVGAHGKIWLVEPLAWQPTVPPMILIAANAVLAIGLCAVVLAGTRGNPDAAATAAAAGAVAAGESAGPGSAAIPASV